MRIVISETVRLRSIREVHDYCLKHDIKFDPSIFCFKGADKYESIVHGHSGSSSAGSSLRCTPPHVSIFESHSTDT